MLKLEFCSIIKKIMKLNITDLGMNFEGVARNEGKVYFVPFGLVGEEVEITPIKDNKKFVNARIDKILTPSSERVMPFCPYFNICGGCDIEHIRYDKQLEYKSKLVQDTLKKVAGITFEVENTTESNLEYFYRNKGAFPISKDGIGMFKHSTHEVLPITQCMLMNNEINIALKVVKQFFAKHNIKGYDFNKHIGNNKFVVIRSVNKQTLVCLVVKEKLENLEELYSNLQEKLDNVGLYLNYNYHKNSTILGDKYEHVAGLKTIKLEEFGISYEVDVASFLQVNPYIKHAIYKQVIDEVDASVVIDAYAGAGLMSAMLAKKAKKVYSVEIVKQASKSAEELKRFNNLNNMEVINGDCAQVIPNIVKSIGKDFSIVLDPARVGCEEKVIKVASLAKKILYISCNPIALAKDLKILTKTHKIDYIKPFDMFPQTKHVETLVCLTKITE